MPLPYRFVVLRDIHTPADVIDLHRAGETEVSLLDLPRKVEQMGYDCLGIGDHLYGTPDPLIDTMACLGVTTKLRVAQTVLVNDYRNPALVAKAINSIDVFSNGRVEVGLGIGYNPDDFRQVGLPYDEPKVRVRRLREALTIVRHLLKSEQALNFKGEFYEINNHVGLPRPEQQPGPPIWVAAGGPVMLRLAGELADVIDIAPQNLHASTLPMDPQQWTLDSFRKKVDLIRKGAGERFDEIYTGFPVFNLRVCDDREKGAHQVHAEFSGAYKAVLNQDMDISVEQIAESPWFWIGTEDEIVDKVNKLRDEFGCSNFIIQPANMLDFQPIRQCLTSVVASSV